MLEFPTVCRFCTKNTSLIYDLHDENSSLSEKLAKLAPDTLEFNEVLPQKICQDCHDKLNESCAFQQQVQKAFNLYKSFSEYQKTLETIDGEPATPVPFQYIDESFYSEDLRHFINNLGNCTGENSESFPNCCLNKVPEEAKGKSKESTPPAPRNQPEIVIKRKRGRPRKYCGLLEFQNDDLTDVQKMKDVVVNSLPNIDPDYVPCPFFEQPMTINLRKKRGRPKIADKEEKEAKKRHDETYTITEPVNKEYEIPVVEAGPSTAPQEEPPQDCDFAAKSQEYLNRHMQSHDDTDENKIECTICKKLLKSRSSFKIHMKRHKDDRALETPYWRTTL